MVVFLILSIIMITEYILERFNVYQIKEGLEDMEHEIVKLKARLYDLTHEEEEEEEGEEEIDSEEVEEEED
jgi:hypothetical protein